MNFAASLIACFALPMGAIAGAAVYDRSETTPRYTSGKTWTGESAIYEYTDGLLFDGRKGKIVGYFGGGRPRLVAFGCEGRAGVLVAMEESDLPVCERVERIEGAPSLAWAR